MLVARQPVERLRDRRELLHREEVLRVGEPGVDQALACREHRAPVVARVAQHDRLGVQADLAQRHHLEKLVEGAEAARQRKEAVRDLDHPRLAHRHVGDDLEPLQAGMPDLLVHQLLRDDAEHLAAGGQRRIRHLAHQADAAAAVDEQPAARGNRAPDLGSERKERRILALAGAAEDGDGARLLTASIPCSSPRLSTGVTPRTAARSSIVHGLAHSPGHRLVRHLAASCRTSPTPPSAPGPAGSRRRRTGPGGPRSPPAPPR